MTLTQLQRRVRELEGRITHLEQAYSLALELQRRVVKVEQELAVLDTLVDTLKTAVLLVAPKRKTR